MHHQNVWEYAGFKLAQQTGRPEICAAALEVLHALKLLSQIYR